jgi:hypothetical protein
MKENLSLITTYHLLLFFKQPYYYKYDYRHTRIAFKTSTKKRLK